MKNQLALFAWSDTKVNFMLGTWPGIQTAEGFKSTIERKKKNVTETRKCPKIANIYNENMGGIDLYDSHRARISTHIRSKKWWTPLFYGCLDIAIVNACINWKEAKNQDITFHDFVIALIEEMKPDIGWWGKKKTAEEPLAKIAKNISIENEDLIHEPFYLKRSRQIDTRKNCAICKKKTNMGCSSCKVSVCFSTCWRTHHNQ